MVQVWPLQASAMGRERHQPQHDLLLALRLRDELAVTHISFLKPWNWRKRNELVGEWVRVHAPVAPRENQMYLVPLDGKFAQVTDSTSFIPIEVRFSDGTLECIWQNAIEVVPAYRETVDRWARLGFHDSNH